LSRRTVRRSTTCGCMDTTCDQQQPNCSIEL
jgi:hypothetical protein